MSKTDSLLLNRSSSRPDLFGIEIVLPLFGKKLFNVAEGRDLVTRYADDNALECYFIRRCPTHHLLKDVPKKTKNPDRSRSRGPGTPNTSKGGRVSTSKSPASRCLVGRVTAACF